MANVLERKNMVLAMERLVRSVNDEDLMMRWLACGVPDGDIDKYTIDEVDDYFVENEHFAELMELFLDIMADAKKDGGLYVDHIVSYRKEETNG